MNRIYRIKDNDVEIQIPKKGFAVLSCPSCPSL
jgi:hypothetical protein